jgi:hypothetical protein
MTNALDESNLRGFARSVNLSLNAGMVLGVLAACGTSCCFGQAAVALTPPMGWNSWNHFAGQVTDADSPVPDIGTIQTCWRLATAK